MKAVEIQQLTFEYKKGVPVFQDFSLSFDTNLFVVVLGANGSGKSTLLKLILGALTAFEGKILLEGKEYEEHDRTAKIGYVPQSYSLDPEMSVNDILDLVGSLYSIHGTELKKRKLYLCEHLGIDKILHRQVKHLSGGQKQLVNVALGIIHDPDIILLDEPFTGLDFGVKSKLISFLNGLDKTIICVSHDLEMAESYAEKVLVIDQGKVQDFRSPKEIISSYPFLLKEIDFKKKIEIKTDFSPEIAVILRDNRLLLSCADRKDLKNEIAVFEEHNASEISGTRSSENNLKSALIGHYRFSLSEFENKKDKGTGKKSKRQ